MPEVLELVSGGAQIPPRQVSAGATSSEPCSTLPTGFRHALFPAQSAWTVDRTGGPFSHSTVFSGSLTFLSWMRVYFRSAFQMVELRPSFLSRAV